MDFSTVVWVLIVVAAGVGVVWWVYNKDNTPTAP